MGGYEGFREKMREFKEKESRGLKKMKCFWVKGHQKPLTTVEEIHHGSWGLSWVIRGEL